jgi:[acyl-carrier-protein] S-malonyltransferase
MAIAKKHTAFLFPGQGSQEVGMGFKLHKKSKAARRVFDEADSVLGISLSQLMFYGPAKELERTNISQPAILTMSLACLAAASEQAGRPLETDASFMAGHSLGEYTALIAANVLEVGEAVWLVRERGRIMQDACDRVLGNMVVILGLGEAVMAEICKKTGTQIANINAPGQIVISGEQAKVAKAMNLASKRGAKHAISLPVSGAFHSYLMAPTLNGMAKALEDVHLRNPATPVIANCSAKPLTSITAIKEELVQQLCGCVRWQDSITFMVNKGVDSFIEFGPGSALTGMVKRIAKGINKSVSIANVSDVDSAARFAGGEIAPS